MLSWPLVLDSFKAVPADPGERNSHRRRTWLEKRLPDFYPATFVFPRVVSKRYAERPLRSSQDRFWGLFDQPQINYLTALLSVQVELKTRGGSSGKFCLGTDALVSFLARNPKLRYLSLYDSGDSGSGILKVIRAVAQYCPKLKFFYSETNGTIPEVEVYRLIAACPELEELAFPNCPRKSTIAKHLGWTFLSKADPDANSGEVKTSQFKEVRHYGGQAGANDWAVSGRDIMRRPADWKGLSAKHLETMEKNDDASRGRSSSSSSEGTSGSSSGSESPRPLF